MTRLPDPSSPPADPHPADPHPADPPRIAGAADLDRLVDVVTLAFADDPVWGPAFPADPGSATRRALWRPYLGAAARLSWSWLTAGGGAVSLWVPPGEVEMTPEQAGALEEVVVERLGGRAADVLALFDRFDSSHPTGEPHYYLTVLATHPDHRGRGIGMGLLADNLARIDAERMPAYLESTNPVNDVRYERLGFRRVGEFAGYLPGSIITTMWRPAARG
jgi:GNAT superfamily N-acetyltransferase